MNRLAVTFIALTMAVPVFGQKESKAVDLELRAGLAGSPQVAADYLSRGSSGSFFYDDYRPDLSDIYGNYFGPAKTSGTLCIECVMRFSKRITLSAGASLTPFWYDEFDGITDSFYRHRFSAAGTIAATIRCHYVSRPNVRVYCGAYLGVAKYMGFDLLKSNSLKAAGGFIPFGLEIGRKIYGFAEFGIGTIYSGVNAGIGYKF